MPDVQVKICGITNAADAHLAVELGAAMLGFNFYPGSPRFVMTAAAAEIIGALPAHVEPVGVFVNASPREVSAIANSTGIRAAQLHGDESAEDCAAVRELAGIRIIKAVRDTSGIAPHDALRFPADAILVDAACGNFGGSGQVSDWRFARTLTTLTPRVMLAGGLNAANVGLAIRTVMPYAVDVASGVESSPGHKDAGRMRAFFRAVAQSMEGESFA